MSDARRAVELFEASIAADPSFARAHEALARTHWEFLYVLGTGSPVVGLSKVRQVAGRALELDDTLAEAHALFAWAQFAIEFDWVRAETALWRAYELEPTNAFVISWLSHLIQAAGRTEEGLALAERAVEADPANLVTRMEYGWALYNDRRFDRVVEEANRMLEEDPGFAKAYDLLGSAYWALGDLEAADRAYREYNILTGRPKWYLDAFAEGASFREKGRLLLAAVLEHDDEGISNYVRAVIACYGGEPDEALVELNHAFRKHDPLMFLIGVWPQLDCVRDDPRFRELLRAINWPGLEE